MNRTPPRRISRRKVLLSMRERPLSLLWLVAFLAPYLSFSLAAIPHFHRDEIAPRVSPIHCAVQAAQQKNSRLQNSSFQNSSVAHHDECFLCDWSSGSTGQNAVAPLSLSVLSSPAEYSALAAPAVVARAVSISARGPPVSL